MSDIVTWRQPRVRWSAFFILVVMAIQSIWSAAVWAEDAPRATLILVTGAPGSEEYGKQFATWADRWEAAANRSKTKIVRIGQTSNADTTDREQLRLQLEAESREGASPLWLVLIGHGTFNGREAKFNLTGPDFTAEDLKSWCVSMTRPLAIVNCSSASGPFLKPLSQAGRVIVTATRSGQEQNFARFGDELSTAIGDETADLDRDGQTSLLEAYLRAARRVAEHYAQAAQLMTEHALLDDNGDGLGTPGDWFQGVRATRRAKDGAPLDGGTAHGWHLVPGDQERQLSPAAHKRRDELEQAIAKLRDVRANLAEDAYLAQLETLVVELARLYHVPSKVEPEKTTDSAGDKK